MPGLREALKELLAGMGGFILIAVVIFLCYLLSADIQPPSEFYQ